jgi:hypothetical protein
MTTRSRDLIQVNIRTAVCEECRSCWAFTRSKQLGVAASVVVSCLVRATICLIRPYFDGARARSLMRKIKKTFLQPTAGLWCRCNGALPHDGRAAGQLIEVCSAVFTPRV